MLRGLLREQGLPVPVGGRTVLARVSTIVGDATVALPGVLRLALSRLIETCWRHSGRARGTPHRLTRVQQWVVARAARRGCNTAAVALANKLARIIWAVWRHDVDVQPRERLTEAA